MKQDGNRNKRFKIENRKETESDTNVLKHTQKLRGNQKE